MINTNKLTPLQYVALITQKTVISDSGCWEYQGKPNVDGYHQVSYRGRKWMLTRLMYTLLVGDIEAGKLICHRCDNPGCWKPGHLFQGTFLENALDCVAKGRHQYQLATTCKNGHPWSPASITKIKTGKQCRICNRISQRIRAGWSREDAETIPVLILGFDKEEYKRTGRGVKKCSRPPNRGEPSSNT